MKVPCRSVSQLTLCSFAFYLGKKGKGWSILAKKGPIGMFLGNPGASQLWPLLSSSSSVRQLLQLLILLVFPHALTHGSDCFCCSHSSQEISVCQRKAGELKDPSWIACEDQCSCVCSTAPSVCAQKQTLKGCATGSDHLSLQKTVCGLQKSPIGQGVALASQHLRMGVILDIIHTSFHQLH